MTDPTPDSRETLDPALERAARAAAEAFHPPNADADDAWWAFAGDSWRNVARAVLAEAARQHEVHVTLNGLGQQGWRCLTCGAEGETDSYWEAVEATETHREQTSAVSAAGDTRPAPDEVIIDSRAEMRDKLAAALRSEPDSSLEYFVDVACATIEDAWRAAGYPPAVLAPTGSPEQPQPPPPLDFPPFNMAITRSVGSLCRWEDHYWRWNGHGWDYGGVATPIRHEPAVQPPDLLAALQASIERRTAQTPTEEETDRG